MKNSSKIITSLCILLLASCQPQALFFEDAICIQNISTVDPNNGLEENQTVVIKDGKIYKIADTATLLLSGENNIIDGTGKYLIPGLWDAHVHFAYIEELAPLMFDMFLSNGITSVRDTGGKVDFVKDWKDKAIARRTAAPRVMMAGPLLDGEPNVYDGSDASHPELSVGLGSVDDVTNQVNRLVGKDVDLLKAYEMLTPEQFRKVNELAKANGLKVTGHVPLSMDVISAANAGLNSMEHLRNLELSCVANSDELLAERQKMLAEGSNMAGGELRTSIHRAQRENALKNYDETKADEVLQVLKDRDVWQVPTLALNTFLSNKYFADPEYQKSYSQLPDSIAQHWKNRSIILKDYPMSEAFQAQVDFNLKMVKKVYEKGIPLMAGTDTPIAYLTPGLSLHIELEALVDAGIPPLEVLKAATYNPAKYFNMQHELGSIKENMYADLVILNANPLDDIQNTKLIDTVIKEGQVYVSEDMKADLKIFRD